MNMNFIEQTGMKIISGGQTGVDLAALRAAQLLGFTTGGAAPLRWKTQVGPQPSLVNFGMHESKAGYAGRTEENVVASDATLLIFANGDSAGTKLTRQHCKHHSRPYLDLDITQPIELLMVDSWIKANGTTATMLTGGFVLNVAGNSSTSAPGIFQAAFSLLFKILKPLISGPSEQDEIDRVEIYRNFSEPNNVAMLNDRFDYIPSLHFRNKLNNVIIDGATKVF